MIIPSSLIRQDREYLASLDTVKELVARGGGLPVVINGLSGGAMDAYLTEILRDGRSLTKSVSLVLVSGDTERARVASLLRAQGFIAEEYKGREPVFNNISASHDVERERLSVLSMILSGGVDAVVTTIDAALGLTMPREILRARSLMLRPGDEIDVIDLYGRLEGLGFSNVESVDGRGQFARRGGIVDFWGADMEYPVRIELFGDEIDRLVYFDPISQRSLENCERISLLPAREVLVDRASLDRIQREIDRLLTNDSLSEEMRARLNSERRAAKTGVGLEFRDKYIRLIYESRECLLSYLPKGTLTLILGTNECRERARAYISRLNDTADAMVSHGAIRRAHAEYTFDCDFFESFANDNITLHINSFSGGIGNMKLSGLFGFRSRPTVSYGGNFSMLREDLEGLVKAMYRTVLLCANSAEAQRLNEELCDAGIAAIPYDPDIDASVENAPGGSIFISVGEYRGFDLISPRIALLSMAEDDGRSVMAHRRKQRVNRRAGGVKRLMSHAELVEGDYVVHSSYGIGLFEGIEAVTVDGVTRDYITIRYAGTDKLFVPCDRLEVLGKYIGERDKDGKVKLSKMGGGDWTRAKSKAKAATKELAKRLIQLYAERQRRPGFAFPKQSELEDKFEAEFEYEETDSQLTAIAEVKADMIRPVPMNRLLCGDVGFGKTEVALRAAFKAILGGKQVAILVPTTILALQHYQTALSRMRGYPVVIEMLSRFRKPKERREIIERTERGRVDILIGTHSIISKQVKFRDLGLLIIDEEQRFGVAQKERLREMASNVDTLMLSATPIPRTLNMAMSGISDISVLDEAPGERRPVQTYVLEHDDGIILDAINREIDRHGQVLYLYNKIEDIDIVAGRLSEALPKARIAYAHGRMEKEELEDIWQYLVRGEIDVFVCTTIIETGVDLPNANTLIIENADKFGLSQLHQIRGRVGRSERQAYAYLTYRPGKALSEIAEKRLETIREFAEFGAGFKIALRDMEIRGAGNLLGAEQHGYIESVGYDLYIKLLNEAILEEKGEKPERFESTVSINLSAHIPESYIPSGAVRMEMYKRIANIYSREDRDDLIDEMCDRFGEVVKPVMRLLNVALIKALAERAKIRKVEAEGARILFISDKPDLAVWSVLFGEIDGLGFLGVGSPIVVYKMRKGCDPCEIAADILSKYIDVLDSSEKENNNE